MWSWKLAAMENGLRRKNEELARYARWEYGGSDGEWMAVQARREARNVSKRGFRSRFRSLLAKRIHSEAVISEDPLADHRIETANDGGVLLTEEIPPQDCTHDDLKSLGGGGNATYYRCQSCAHVVIAQGGTWWVLSSRKRIESTG